MICCVRCCGEDKKAMKVEKKERKMRHLFYSQEWFRRTVEKKPGKQEEPMMSLSHLVHLLFCCCFSYSN